MAASVSMPTKFVPSLWQIRICTTCLSLGVAHILNIQMLLTSSSNFARAVSTPTFSAVDSAFVACALKDCTFLVNCPNNSSLLLRFSPPSASCPPCPLEFSCLKEQLLPANNLQKHVLFGECGFAMRDYRSLDLDLKPPSALHFRCASALSSLHFLCASAFSSLHFLCASALYSALVLSVLPH